MKFTRMYSFINMVVIWVLLMTGFTIKTLDNIKKNVVILGIGILFILIDYVTKELKNKYSAVERFTYALMILGLSVIISIGLERLIFDVFLVDRVILINLCLILIILHIVLDRYKMYRFIFKYRWFILLAILIFMVLNKYHGSSIAMYNNYIQPNSGNEYSDPILGIARAIRSDEWTNATPRKLAAGWGAEPYSLYNNILRGTLTLNTTNGMYYGIGALAFPHSWGFLLFGSEYGLSFWWFGLLLFAIGIGFEFFYIITKRNKLAATAGAFMFALSPFMSWWSYFSTEYIFCIAFFVFLYYFVHNKQVWKKVAYTIGMVIMGASFVCRLYPAWQVPLGYLTLILIVWVFIDGKDRIKLMRWQDWGILAAGVIVAAFIIFSYLNDHKPYIEAISKTVYPGKRFDAGGSMPVFTLFAQLPSILFPYKDFGNPCEAGNFITLFMLPLFGGGWLLFKSKNKAEKVLIALLICFSIFITFYLIIGFPSWFAKITLMSYSTTGRALPVLGLAQLILLIIIINGLIKVPIKNKVYIWIFSLVNTAIALVCGYLLRLEYIPIWFMFTSAVVFTLLSYMILKPSKKTNQIVCGILILISILSGLSVNPLMKGLDAIRSKPVAKEIMKITSEDENGKWIALDSWVLSGFTISCGAPTINSCNYYPNINLWNDLELYKEYEDTFNRFAYMNVELTESNSIVELNQADLITLKLSYLDLKKIDVKYILSLKHLDDVEGVKFNEYYYEDNCYIYEVNYTE